VRRQVRDKRALARAALARGEAEDVHDALRISRWDRRVRNFLDSSKGKVTT
jgi:hypothetical protein